METFNDVISSDKLVLVDFFATWCQPCKMMHPVLEDLKKTVGDKLRIIKVDVDTHNDVAAQYGIRSVPTLMLFRNGTVEATKVGAVSKSQLIAFLDSSLS